MTAGPRRTSAPTLTRCSPGSRGSAPAPSAAGSRSSSAPRRASARPTRCWPRRSSCARRGATSSSASSRRTAATRRRGCWRASRCCRARRVEYRDHVLEEFDLDAALARKPAILLVDELAHTNAPGSRHPKRCQDVQELLAAGIDVYTTVNVQHLESLNDIVGGITGIKVRETLPDRVFDDADEVVLVDLTPDDLLQRLKEGKVYFPEQAARAIQNFFRKGNLLALRELSLRRTADRVDTQMRTYRVEHVARAPVWKTRDALLVGVGPEPRRRVGRARGGPSRGRARRELARGLRRDAGARTRIALAAPRDPRDVEARAGARRADGDGRGAGSGVRPRRLRALAQPGPARARPAWPRGAASSLSGAHGQAWRASALAPDLDVVLIGRESPQESAVARSRSPASPRSTLWRRYGGALALVGGDDARRLPAAALVRALEHRDAVPARGRRRRARPSGADRPSSRRSSTCSRSTSSSCRRSSRSRCPTRSTCSRSS